MLRSSAAAARLGDAAPDLRRVATEIEVDLVLTGTLMRAGEQLRATTQLVEAPAGTIVSSQTLHAPIGDVFALQDELARPQRRRAVATAGGPRARRAPAPGPRQRSRVRAIPAPNEVVRDWSQAASARDLFRRCVEEDPGFAPAWAKLGRCHRLLAKYHLEQPAHNLGQAEAAFAADSMEESHPNHKHDADQIRESIRRSQLIGYKTNDKVIKYYSALKSLLSRRGT